MAQSLWNVLYKVQPADGATVWIRLVTSALYPMLAVWDSTAETMTVTGWTTPIPWYLIERWRPQ